MSTASIRFFVNVLHEIFCFWIDSKQVIFSKILMVHQRHLIETVYYLTNSHRPIPDVMNNTDFCYFFRVIVMVFEQSLKWSTKNQCSNVSIFLHPVSLTSFWRSVPRSLNVFIIIFVDQI